MKCGTKASINQTRSTGPASSWRSNSRRLLWLAIWLGLASAFALCAKAAETSASADAEVATDANLAAEWKPLDLPRALIAVGVWGDLFQWREALHGQGIEYHDAYRAQNAYHQPLVQMVNMPTQMAELQEFSTIVLINVDAPALGQQRLEAIRQFVRQGGGLVVLGGYWAYERGAYAGTPLEEMLPVETPPRGDMPHHRQGLALSAAEGSSWTWQADFSSAPSVYYLHALQPRPNTKTLLRAGDHGVLFAGEFGAGRVVASGLTVNGKPHGEETPFWEWPAWPSVLGQAIEWSGANRPLRIDASSAARLTPVEAEEAEKLRLDFQPLSKEVIARFQSAPTAAAAEAIVSLVFPENRQKVELSPELIDALASWADAAWGERLLKAADGLNPSLAERNAALELLGASQAPAAARRLLAALEDEDVSAGAIAGLRRLNDPRHLPTLLRIYERNAAGADFRNYDLESVTAAAAVGKGRVAVEAAIALYHLGDPAGLERMLELHRQIGFLRRVFTNAAKRRVLETDPTGVAMRASILKKAGDFRQLEQELLRRAGPPPESQRATFIALAKEATQPEDVLFLAKAMRDSMTGTDWTPLAPAKDGILRRLAGALSETK